MQHQKNAAERRAANEEVFTRMLGHLGRKEFDEFQSYLADDFLQEWPYLASPDQPPSLRGPRALRDMIEIGTQPFDPFAYRISRFYHMEDPDTLIVEYSSHSAYRPRNSPYSNLYLGIVRLRDGKIVYWKEYLNPMVVMEALGADAQKSMADRAG